MFFPLAARDMGEIATPIETPVGTINGRDGIYLDSVAYSRSPDVLTLIGEFNASLCSQAPAGKWIPYRISFKAVLYFQVAELDIDLRELTHESSFDVLQNSLLMESFRKSDHDNKVTPEHQHFLFCTYDRVFEIVSSGYELTIGEARSG